MTELLRADHLTRHFSIGGTLARGTLHAVDDVSFSIGEREIVALAGESGSGKSTVARLLARVYKPTSGTVAFEGRPLSAPTAARCSRSLADSSLTAHSARRQRSPWNSASRTPNCRRD